MRLPQVHAERANSFSISISMSSLWKNFPRVNVPGSGGMRFDDVRASFIGVVETQKNLLGLDVAQYNPGQIPMAAARKKLVGSFGRSAFRAPRNPAAPAAEPAGGPQEVSSSETSA